ncbi:MAG TPA: polysaccharide biosynthesis tyrosine autokinase [Bacteroidia bacterium]|nr:polysaccharide biosynthesis tyrosine autokinase [Bacteroidia bacterium]
MIQENFSASSDSFERYKERLTNFSNEFEPALFISLAWKSILWVILFFSVSLSVAFLYLRYTPKVFEASTILQINNSNNANKVLESSKIFDGESQDALAGDIELLRSKVFLKRVLSTLPLEVTYFDEGTFRTNEHYKESPYAVEKKLKTGDIRGVRIFITRKSPTSGVLSYTINGKKYEREFHDGQWITDLPQADLKIAILDKNWNVTSAVKKTLSYFVINDFGTLADSYHNRLSITLLNDAAKTVRIMFRDNNAVKTSDVVGSIYSEFIAYDVERRSESAKNVLEFIDNQLDAVFNRLKSSESSLETFKRVNKVSPSMDMASVNTIRLNALEDDIMRTELEENVLDEISKKVKTDVKPDVSSLLSMLAGSENLASLNAQVSTLYKLILDREEALFQNKSENQSIKAYDYQINIQKNMLLESIDAVKAKMQTKKENLNKISREYQIKFEHDPGAEVEYSRLQHLYEINEKFYTLLLEKKTEYQISKAGFTSKHLVLENPVTPTVPVFPNPNISFTLAIFSGLLLSLVLVLMRYLLHNKISSLNEITRHTGAGISILGIIPKYKKDIPVSQLLVDKNPKSLIAEAFRSVRSNMHFIAEENGPKVMTVTSTISGEGKTFVALNLAGIIAYSGKRVVILDLDMRKPKIHIGLEVSNLKGMSTILIGRHTVEECIQHSQLENMDFITSGPIPPNPSELMLSKKMYEIIDYLKTKYDMIIIDNPPVGLVTDGIDLMRRADYPIYIFRADYSKRSFIQNVDRLQNESGIKKISVILNGVDIDKRGYGYNYGYGHGYGYGYGSSYGYYDEARPGKPGSFKRRSKNK